ncbi:hypothetical protein [Streptomyces sp. NBC_00289]|uniref:hypothetical protein n=1 Tax=Streptomyces sp. NBC_00289 TaxID=2975703 RepID=UPI00352E91EB
MLAQRKVNAKSNEITAFRPLLNPLDLTGAVVTWPNAFAGIGLLRIVSTMSGM